MTARVDVAWWSFFVAHLFFGLGLVCAPLVLGIRARAPHGRPAEVV